MPQKVMPTTTSFETHKVVHFRGVLKEAKDLRRAKYLAEHLEATLLQDCNNWVSSAGKHNGVFDTRDTYEGRFR